MGDGLESRCVGRVYRADGAVHGTPIGGRTAVLLPIGVIIPEAV